MIKVNLLKSYWDAMAARVGAAQTINVRTEGELAQKIKSIKAGDLFLVAVFPSADSSARNFDNILETELIIVYALKKVSRRDQKDEDIIADMLETQLCITAVKNCMLADATNCDAYMHEYLSRVDFNKIHTDPEYRYLECDGYSISFPISSTGF